MPPTRRKRKSNPTASATVSGKDITSKGSKSKRSRNSEVNSQPGSSGDAVASVATSSSDNTRTTKKDKQTTNKSKSTKKASSPESATTGPQRLPFAFFDKPCIELANDLLGKRLMRKLDSGEVVSGIIVETEAYLGGDDLAAHSTGGKKTPRNAAMFMAPATGYVYHIYGTYTCFNISSKGDGAAVLVRGLDVTLGLDVARKFRGVKRSDKGQRLKDKELGNGPSKLTQALAINRENTDQTNLTTTTHLWLEDSNDLTQKVIVSCSRIGMDYAGDWAKKPLRFYVRGNKSVSIKNKEAEELLDGD